MGVEQEHGDSISEVMDPDIATSEAEKFAES